jgi:hypothetical protein
LAGLIPNGLFGRGRDLAKFGALPVLYEWHWTEREWAAMVPVRGKLIWKRVLALPAVFSAFFLALRWLKLGWPSLPRAQEDFLAFLSYFMLLTMAVCVIAKGAVRLGNRVLWLSSNIIKIETAQTNLGPSVIITRRIHLASHHHWDTVFTIPVPRDTPELARQVADTFAAEFGTRAQDTSLAHSTRKYELGLPKNQKKAIALLAAAGCCGVGFLAWEEHSLNKFGVITQGQVLEKSTWESNHAPNYYLEYSYQAGDLRLTGKGHTDEATYSSVEPGSSIPIRYLKYRPSISQPWRANRRDGVKGKIMLMIALAGVTLKLAFDSIG